MWSYFLSPKCLTLFCNKWRYEAFLLHLHQLESYKINLIKNIIIILNAYLIIRCAFNSPDLPNGVHLIVPCKNVIWKWDRYQIRSFGEIKHEDEYLFFQFYMGFSKLDFEILCANITNNKNFCFHKNSKFNKNEKNDFFYQILCLRVVLSHAEVEFSRIRSRDHSFLQNIEKTQRCI